MVISLLHFDLNLKVFQRQPSLMKSIQELKSDSSLCTFNYLRIKKGIRYRFFLDKFYIKNLNHINFGADLYFAIKKIYPSMLSIQQFLVVESNI